MSLDLFRATSQEKVLDAEQAVLGAMLMSASAIEDVCRILEPTDYYRPAHETIYRAICQMREQGTPADPITTAAFLGRSGDLNRVGGAPYLHTLVQAVPTVAHAEHYAHIIKEAAQDRRLDSAGMRILHRGDEGDTETVRAGAIAALEQLATTDQWGDPTPLGEQRALPTFPVESLPGWLRDQVSAVAEFTQTPPDLAATMGLAALSTAAGGRVNIQVRPGWTEQTNLYLVCAMPPASRKSDVFASMTAPIYRIECELQQQARSGIIEAQTAKDAAEAEVEGLMAKARKASDTIDRQQLVAEVSAARMLADEIRVPPTPRLTVSGDITPEPLTHLLATHRCLAALSPEGDLFDIIAGRYSGTPNLGVFLQAHKGERLQTDRITRDQPTVDRPALTIGVTPQPTVLQDLAAAAGARDRGLLARFLFALPPSNLGFRRVRTAPVPEATANAYDARLDLLVRTLTDLPEAVTIPITARADAAVEHLQEELETQLRPEQPLSHITDWAGKLVGATVRIAGLLHLADHITTRWGDPVSEDCIQRAAAIASYYTAHALAVFDLIGADPAASDAGHILEWLARPRQNGSQRTTVKRRDVVGGVRRFRGRTGDIDPSLRLLEEHGYLRSDPAPSSGRGRAANVTFRVHPRLRELLDEL
ncbi:MULTISPECIES: DUF3987 domain-containing protein [Streptomyces]|uniref:DUF3987 domain-containing protein n=1 Tax=Streptomyces TaxID=1883 RepID=UPI0027E3E613|nr:DUF3987 domain-containing protein [Streptomyces sp. 43Y-GA-1]